MTTLPPILTKQEIYAAREARKQQAKQARAAIRATARASRHANILAANAARVRMWRENAELKRKLRAELAASTKAEADSKLQALLDGMSKELGI
jgi:hypothetical protein